MNETLKKTSRYEPSAVSLAPTVRDYDQFRMQAENIILSPVKLLREQCGVSQTKLANLIGMERTRLVRLEQKNWGEISINDLEMISNALGFRLMDILGRFSHYGREEAVSNRTLLASPHFKIESVKGYRFGSILEKPESCFIGTLSIQPKKSVPPEEAPRAQFIFFLVLEGDLHMTIGCREYRIREKESFTVNAASNYELYNPHQFKEVNMLIFSLPSFIQKS